MKNKIRTVYDAGQERRDETALAIGRAIAAQNKLNLERDTLHKYPEIGILTRSHGTRTFTVFYAYVGVARNYVESRDIDTIARDLDAGKPRICAP